MPLVSVIIPNYNHAPFLHKRIDSVLNQSFRDFELIILDDGSNDNSKEIIESYRNHLSITNIIYNDQNSGSPFRQWEKGIGLATGDFIWIAESDDWADVLFLEKLMPSLLADREVALAYCQTYDVDEKEEIFESRIVWTEEFEPNIWNSDFCLPGKMMLPYLYQKNIIPNASACLIRKNIIKQILLRKNIIQFSMCGDWMMWLQIADMRNLKIAFIAEHLNYFRSSRQSTRIHNTKKRHVRRLLEEAAIFNSGSLALDKKILQAKNNDLKARWFTVFRQKRWSFAFFDICSYLQTGKFFLLMQYLRAK